MPALSFKPHQLSFLISRPGYEDDNGDWHEGSHVWSEPIDCHAVPSSGSSNQLTYADGKAYTYSFTVGRLDKNCREFTIGERIRLNLLGEIYESTVKGFRRYQLQSKLWV